MEETPIENPEVNPELEAGSDASVENELTQDRVIAAIKEVFDPEIPVDIYELGLIYEIAIDSDGTVSIMMTLTSPGCPAAGMLPGEVQDSIRKIPGVKDVHVDITFDPPWEMGMMSDEAKLELGYL